MVDSVSQTSGATAASLAETLAQRNSATTSTKNSATAGRSIDDVVDLSQAARVAAELRGSDLSGKKLTDKLAESLDQGKSLGESFAAQMKAGRKDSSDTSSDDYGAALRGAVSDILSSGKPGSIYSGIVNRLFKS
ncbi:MAG: hypothetical protein H7Z12_04420 [Rhodospirillaceae bacterium]|nr:hypothetical protein [Rhodospirillales bacterium]